MRTGEGDERVTTSWLDLLPEDDDDGDGTDHRFLLRPLLLVFTSTAPEHGAAASGPPHDTGRSSARASGTPRDTDEACLAAATPLPWTDDEEDAAVPCAAMEAKRYEDPGAAMREGGGGSRP